MIGRKSKNAMKKKIQELEEKIAILERKNNNYEIITRQLGIRLGDDSTLNYSLVFEVTPEEREQIEEWKEQHIKEKHKGNNYSGAFGGRYTYEFIPTSIGDIGTIKCGCGAEFTFKELK